MTTAPADSFGDDAAAFSPDGRRLAFSRRRGGASDIYNLSLGDELKPAAAPVQLTTTGSLGSPVWTADGRELVFTQWNNPGTSKLLRMQAAKGALPSPVLSESGSSPAISRQGSRMAFVREVSDRNVWRAPAQGGKEASLAVALIASTRVDQTAQYSPDGKQIVFVSDRSGWPEIWIAGSDGTNPIQVTSLNGEQTGSPYWSPDGQRIVFDSSSAGVTHIYVIPVSGGKPLQITNSPSACVIPRYSRDGKWIYFASDRSGRFEVWKVSPQGGQVVQVTRNGGYTAEESPDGSWLYFTTKPGIGIESPLMKMPSAGGPETQVLPAVIYRGFAPVRKGVYFIYREGVKSASIRFLNEATGEVRKLLSLTKPLWNILSISPDEQFVLWSQDDHSGSDLMLIENFR